MQIHAPRRWPSTPQGARSLQQALRDQVVMTGAPSALRYAAGIDVGFEDNGIVARAAVVVLQLPSLVPIDAAIARAEVRFPYLPGLLSFRETPVVLKALRTLRTTPDVLLCDGHGYAHPRRFGLACHLGLLTDLPAIGVAKTILIGTHGAVPQRRGVWTRLTLGQETLGAVLRTREGVKPIFVSIGHRVDLKAAIRIVLRCTPRFRLPETTRWAHRLASSPAHESTRLLRALRARAVG